MSEAKQASMIGYSYKKETSRNKEGPPVEVHMLVESIKELYEVDL